MQLNKVLNDETIIINKNNANNVGIFKNETSNAVAQDKELLANRLDTKSPISNLNSNELSNVESSTLNDFENKEPMSNVSLESKHNSEKNNLETINDISAIHQKKNHPDDNKLNTKESTLNIALEMKQDTHLEKNIASQAKEETIIDLPNKNEKALSAELQTKKVCSFEDKASEVEALIPTAFQNEVSNSSDSATNSENKANEEINEEFNNEKLLIKSETSENCSNSSNFIDRSNILDRLLNDSQFNDEFGETPLQLISTTNNLTSSENEQATTVISNEGLFNKSTTVASNIFEEQMKPKEKKENNSNVLQSFNESLLQISEEITIENASNINEKNKEVIENKDKELPLDMPMLILEPNNEFGKSNNPEFNFNNEEELSTISAIESNEFPELESLSLLKSQDQNNENNEGIDTVTEPVEISFFSLDDENLIITSEQALEMFESSSVNEPKAINYQTSNSEVTNSAFSESSPACKKYNEENVTETIVSNNFLPNDSIQYDFLDAPTFSSPDSVTVTSQYNSTQTTNSCDLVSSEIEVLTSSSNVCNSEEPQYTDISTSLKTDDTSAAVTEALQTLV